MSEGFGEGSLDLCVEVFEKRSEVGSGGFEVLDLLVEVGVSLLQGGKLA